MVILWVFIPSIGNDNACAHLKLQSALTVKAVEYSAPGSRLLNGRHEDRSCQDTAKKVCNPAASG
jgi:hypothetical protein